MPKRVRAIVLALIAAAVLAFGAFAFVACDQGGDSGGGKNSPTVSENAATYDVFTGGDYTFKADLKGAEDFTLWMDGSRLGSSQYSYEGGTFTVFAIVMEYLEPDTDLKRAISAKELLVGVEEDIRTAYREKYGRNV